MSQGFLKVDLSHYEPKVGVRKIDTDGREYQWRGKMLGWQRVVDEHIHDACVVDAKAGEPPRLETDSAKRKPDGENPKMKFGIEKPSIEFVPPLAVLEEAKVMALGAKKYGAFNWRDDPVRATTYYSAAFRHMVEWFEGRDLDGESGVHHLAHARACFGIIIDALAHGAMIDDRPVSKP